MKVEVSQAAVDQIIADTGIGPEAAIPLLQGVQETFGYLPEMALRRICETTEIQAATLEGIATFFAQFRRIPVGKHLISVCDGTACHVKGAVSIYDALVEKLDLEEGKDTDADGKFTLQKVACLGCCTLAPAVQIDEVTYGHLRPDTVPGMLDDFMKHVAGKGKTKSTVRAREDETAGEIRVGLGSCCVAGGSEKIRQTLETTLAELESNIKVKHVSCVGMCHQTPLLEIRLPDMPPKLYAKVDAEDVPEILAKHLTPARPWTRLKSKATRWLERLYSDDGRLAPERHALDVRDPHVDAFLGKQKRLATEYCGEIAPTDLAEYKKLEGFEAARKCLTEMTPEAVIEEILQSGLRGRGGAGFPTGRKWQFVRGAEGDDKYLICNGDEGDPGAFMDRMILESYPFRVIEGMIIASYAVGAQEGILYIRAEYPLAVRRVREAIAICEAEGLLGKNILGSDHSLNLRIMEGAGAFVCGEETALIASLEGRRGTPNIRPPFPAIKGFRDAPTLVNNTETLALLPWILRNGAEAFAALGTEKSTGTKVFSLAGKVKRGGLIEVPMGVTIREIVEEIGGGTATGNFKAVQVGGPSGGCIPASLGDTRVDYEALAAVGAMMGSGGFVVLDDSDCMVEMTRYFLTFTQRESCGKCTPCRIGTKRMLEILSRLCEGEAKPGDLEQLESLAHHVKAQSLCGLGKTAPNPVLTTLKYFREEFDAHAQGKCPAGKCKDLITYSITDDCIGCTKCAQVCPVDAIPMMPYEVHTLDSMLCTRCDLCRQVCPVDAVKVT